MTRDEAWKLGHNHWVGAWNAQDLDLIMTRYEDAIELTSPVAARLLGTPDGKVGWQGELEELTFQRGLTAFPELHFRLEDVLWGMNSMVLYYTNPGRRARRNSWSCQRMEKWRELWRTIAPNEEENTWARADFFSCWTPFMEAILRRRFICDE